jgi:ADP-ribose pyrophosphatase YjhB (NUDIX family)
MLINRIGFAWKSLPSWVRLGITRATQVKFTASAAAIVTNDRGQILLLNHVLRPVSGWGLPGGFLDAGEQPEDTIRREIREETGLDLKNLEMFMVRTVRRHVEFLFRGEGVGDAQVLSREILELGWFDLDAMPKKMSASQRAMIIEVLGRDV